jgi:lipoate-protein ligase A
MSSKPLLVESLPPGESGHIAPELACDELLLLEAEEFGGPGVLRFWVPAETGVVAGYTNAPGREVNLSACHTRGIPVFRRITGGGAVVIAPGCLNFTFVLPVRSSPAYATARSTSREIISRTIRALDPLLPGRHLGVGGDGDLTVDGRKALGSAQKRLASCLLFHASLLLDLDVALVSELLPRPSREPGYRNGREHHSFMANVGLSAAAVIDAIIREWDAGETRPVPDGAAIRRLAGDKYRPIGPA